MDPFICWFFLACVAGAGAEYRARVGKVRTRKRRERREKGNLREELEAMFFLACAGLFSLC